MFPGIRFDAFLFDMDGTVLTSLAVTERIWTAWAIRHGIDPAALLPTIHGMRAGDTVARLAIPGVDAEAEAAAIIEAESRDMTGVEALPGAPAFVEALPADRWAIVTSAPRDLALRRLRASGIPIPAVLVTADDVTEGKPAPDGFRLAAARLGVDPAACLAFEDSPAGIAAAEAAGMRVLVITACQPHRVTTAHPSSADYRPLRPAVHGDGAALSLAAA